ncbi:MAG: purine-nucleoside phosphorylase [Oscillospiraceae bacterium]|nr:purine-nucleoside phosphorylase [Oscillospiraceae bacterium]
MANTPTPHINASPEDFAKTVLMPGDPLRAKYIAENYLEDAKLVNNVRGIQGYTGTYKGVPVSVMASGMGIPSIGIYAYELFNFFNIENIIRIGSAGAIADDLQLRDIVAGMSACTNSNFAAQYDLPGTYAPTASYKLLKTLTDTADELGTPIKVGSFYSSDTFYDDTNGLAVWQKMHNVLATEMESAALYMIAARAGKNALAICTISDAPLRGESLDAEARQNTFTQMMEIALNTAIKLK